MGAIGRWLRHKVLNPVKNIVAKTPVGQLIEAIIPGGLDPAVNIFADPVATAPMINPSTGLPVGASLPVVVSPPTSAAPGTVTIPVQHLQALVAEARAAQVLRTQLAAFTNRTLVPTAVPPVPNLGTRADPNMAAIAAMFGPR